MSEDINGPIHGWKPPNTILNINAPAILGGPNFASEIATVGEVGYRSQAWNRLTYSISVFYNDYEKLRSGQPGPPGGDDQLVA